MRDLMQFLVVFGPLAAALFCWVRSRKSNHQDDNHNQED